MMMLKKNFSRLGIYSKFIIITVFLYAFILWSPVFSSITSLGINYYLFIQLLLILFFLIFKKEKISKNVLFTSLLLLAGSALYVLYWGQGIKILFYPLIFIFSLFFVSFLNKNEINSFIDIASVYIVILLIGGVIGFFYAFMGGEALFSITDAADRKIYYYLSTFTGSVKSTLGFNIIRVSGIYDEPGAFSFVVCVVALLRHVSGKNRKLTWAILISGFITFSLAHFVYVIFHLLSEKISFKKILKLVIPIIVFLSIIIISNLGLIFDALILSRLEVTKSGEIRGDNRTEQLFDNIELLQEEKAGVFVWGLDSDCVLNARECRNKFPSVGTSNPLTPLMRSGLILSWPYYLILITCILIAVRKRYYWVYFGLFLLLLQRPYVMSFGYSLLILLPIIKYKSYRMNFTNIVKNTKIK
jgi:hypothetical protein